MSQPRSKYKKDLIDQNCWLFLCKFLSFTWFCIISSFHHWACRHFRMPPFNSTFWTFLFFCFLFSVFLWAIVWKMASLSTIKAFNISCFCAGLSLWAIWSYMSWLSTFETLIVCVGSWIFKCFLNMTIAGVIIVVFLWAIRSYMTWFIAPIASDRCVSIGIIIISRLVIVILNWIHAWNVTLIIFFRKTYFFQIIIIFNEFLHCQNPFLLYLPQLFVDGNHRIKCFSSCFF